MCCFHLQLHSQLYVFKIDMLMNRTGKFMHQSWKHTGLTTYRATSKRRFHFHPYKNYKHSLIRESREKKWSHVSDVSVCMSRHGIYETARKISSTFQHFSGLNNNDVISHCTPIAHMAIWHARVVNASSAHTKLVPTFKWQTSKIVQRLDASKPWLGRLVAVANAYFDANVHRKLFDVCNLNGG